MKNPVETPIREVMRIYVIIIDHTATYKVIISPMQIHIQNRQFYRINKLLIFVDED